MESYDRCSSPVAAIDSRLVRADSVITCFPASSADAAIRAKAILNHEVGAIEMRRYAGGIVIVEPTSNDETVDTGPLLAGPVQ